MNFTDSLLKAQAHRRAVPLPSSSARIAPFMLFALLLASVILLVFPHSAYAWPWDSAVEDLQNYLKYCLLMIDEWLFQQAFAIIEQVTADSILTSTWGELFSSGSTDAIATFAQNVCKNAVKPIASTLVSLVILIQLVKISSRMDVQGTIPAVKEMVVLFVVCAIFIYLINNAEEMCGGIYNLINTISTTISGLTADQAVSFDVATSGIDENSLDNMSNYDFGSLIGLAIGGIFAFIIMCAAYVIALLMAYARGLQLYFMMAFSPIAFAFLGAEETRQWGVGFIKNFIAVCLAGAVMVFILLAFPSVCASVLSGSLASGTYELTLLNLGTASEVIDLVLNILKVIVVALITCYALIKSGAWARDILGG